MMMDANYRRNVKKDPKFTILEFKKVFAQTKAQLMRVLRKGPKTIEEVFTVATPYIEF